MENTLTLNLLLTALYFFILILIYLFYQLARNNKVYNIRIKWIYNDDKRYGKYTYNEMFKASHRNYLGLKYPNEKDFN
jgi:predicted PurR-regulated permease PerM